jgi:hypothetical protein
MNLSILDIVFFGTYRKSPGWRYASSFRSAVFNIFFMFSFFTCIHPSGTRWNNNTCECFALSFRPPAMATASVAEVSPRRSNFPGRPTSPPTIFHVDDWIVQNLGIRRSQRIAHFGQRLALYTYAVHATKRNITVRLYGHRLIEFRRKRKAQLQHIGGVYLIAPTAMFKSGGLLVIPSSVAVLADDRL